MKDEALTDIIAAHKHSTRHRNEILASELCSCFFCLTIFPPREIVEWVDEDENDDVGQTALCPKCGIDSVIGSNSGYSIERPFLAEMKQHWF
jgi:hypothetical protein